MPAKGVKSTKPKSTKPKSVKSNVAKSSSKTGLLSKKISFNWKIAAVIGVILVAALGYLFVRLSQAGGYVWAPNDIDVRAGQRVTKTDGTPAIQSVARDGRQLISVQVNSNPTNTTGSWDSYCVRWKATEQPNIEIDYYYDGIIKPNTQLPIKALDDGTTGDYKNSCARVPNNDLGRKRYVTFRLDASPGGSIGLYAIYRKGDTGFRPPERITNPNPSAKSPNPNNLVPPSTPSPNPAAKSPAPAPQGLCEGQNVFGPGSQGGCVRIIQQRLTDLGYAPGAVDGIYGQNTANAVRVFQQRNGLAQDGVVGVQTWNKLTDPNAARKQ